MRPLRAISRHRGSVVTIAFALALTFAVGGFVPGASATTGTGGIRQWVARYKSPSDRGVVSVAVAVSPDGSKVYMIGHSMGQNYHYVTVAFDAATGATVWSARYGTHGQPGALAVSPDGHMVYVTGYDSGPGLNVEDYATVAYDAHSGARVWVRRYNGGDYSDDTAVAVAVSPDNHVLYVTGGIQGPEGYATVTFAYEAATGETIWQARYDGPNADNGSFSTPYDLALSPDGAAVYVTGESNGGTGTREDYATVAYDAATGVEKWVARYNGPANGDDHGYSVGVSPDNMRVYVTGYSLGSGTMDDFATLAYDATTGAPVWVARYNGPANDTDQAYAIAVSPDGTRLYVLGVSDGYVTIAYDAATGSAAWLSRYHPVRTGSTPFALAVSPDGARVYVTGQTANTDQSALRNDNDYGTVAYDAVTGAQAWARRYTGPRTAPGDYGDVAYSIAVSPDSANVYVTGESDGRFGAGVHPANNATVAYRAR